MRTLLPEYYVEIGQMLSIRKALNYQNKKSILLVVVVLIFIGILMATNTGCEGKLPIRLINQTGQTLTIYINEQKICDIKSGEELKNQTLSATFREYLVEAKNTQGEVIFSKRYTFDELSRDLDWKVIITKS